MSRALSPPWILKYLLDVAVTYGGNLIGAPFFMANKKVQLTKFITHQRPNEHTWLWAQVSDMAYTIPVRFSGAAMEAYTHDPSFGETPVHEWKTAFITIKNFRPMLSRVPLGPAQQGMSPEPHIVLEVDSFEIKGSTGVDVWGKPVNAEFNEDVKLWVEGMREGGGNGNVLQLRKLEEEKAAAQQVDSERQDMRVVGLQTSIRQTFRPVRPQASVKATHSKGERVADDDCQQREKGHRASASSNRRAKFFVVVPPDSKFLEILSSTEILDPKFQTEPVVEKPRRRAPPRPTVSTPPKRRSALDFSSSPLNNDQGSQPRRQTTPSDWSPSQRDPHSSAPSSPIQSKGVIIQETDDEDEADEESRPVSPISAQPMRVDKDIVSKDFGEEAPLANDIQSDLQSAGRSKSFQQDHPRRSSTPARPLQPRSPSPGFLLVPSSSAIPTQNTIDSSPLAPGLAKRIQRKNAADEDSVMNDLSGPGNILVPNSDTSGTASHSQPSQSQPQRRRFDQTKWFLDSQSQGRDQTQDSPMKSAPGASQIEQEEEEEEKEEEERPIAQSLSYTSQSQCQSQQQLGDRTQPSQEHPIAQSLSYTSQSQSQSQSQLQSKRQTRSSQEVLQENFETHADANADGTEQQDTVIHEEDDSTNTNQDVVAQDADPLGNRGAPLAREDGNNTDVTAEESDDEEKARALPAQVHVAMEKEESSDEDGEFEVFASLTQPLSDEHDEDAEEVEQEQDELDSERDFQEMSSDDVQAAQMIRTAAYDIRDLSASPQVEDVSMMSATFSPEKDKLPVTRRYTARRGRRRTLPAHSSLPTQSSLKEDPPTARESTARYGRRRTLPIHSSPPHDPPSSRSPSLPSEPDVFMDKTSLSTHVQSFVPKQSILESRNAHADTPSISISSRRPHQSSDIQINAEAGPSTVISSPSKSPSSSPSRPRARFLLHDPVAWAAPSFLRNSGKTASSKRTGRTTSAIPAGSSASHKGKQPVIGLSAKSESKEQEQMVSAGGPSHLPVDSFATSKRRRPTEEPEISNTDLRPSKRRKHEELPSLPPAPDMRRRRSVVRDQGPTLNKSDSLGSTIERFKEIDFRRESSVSSSGSGARQKKSMRKSLKPFLSSVGGQERKEDVQSPARASGSRSILGQPPPRRKLKLGGFTLELDVDVSSHPGLITWQSMGATMKTVFERRKEERERERQAQ